MPIIKKILFLSIVITVIVTSKTFAEDLKKVGKYKDWDRCRYNRCYRYRFISVGNCSICYSIFIIYLTSRNISGITVL